MRGLYTFIKHTSPPLNGYMCICECLLKLFVLVLNVESLYVFSHAPQPTSLSPPPPSPAPCRTHRATPSASFQTPHGLKCSGSTAPSSNRFSGHACPDVSPLKPRAALRAPQQWLHVTASKWLLGSTLAVKKKKRRLHVGRSRQTPGRRRLLPRCTWATRAAEPVRKSVL